MPKYPGLGLPLRHDPVDTDDDSIFFHPIGAHGNCRAATSMILPVREIAMMSVMDSLTDKEDWHKKVFDDGIISKWREEAMSIPDEDFVQLAVRDKRWNENSLHGIMTANTFDYVCQIFNI